MEQDNLTPEEIETLVDKLAAYMNSEVSQKVVMAPNASTFTYDEPLTLSKLMEMKAKVDSIFSPESIKFKKGADMSRKTFISLGIPMASNDGGNTYFDFHKVSLIGIDVHIVDSLPFGVVEDCMCEERAKENNERQK